MTNQAKVGIFSAVAIAVFILGFYFLKGIDLFDRKKVYYAIYTRVDGLYKSNPVEVNGFPVGRVGDMSRDPKTGIIVVEFEINKDVEIPKSKDTKALLVATDIMGSKKVKLVFGRSNVVMQSGDTIHTEFREDLGEQIDPIIMDVKDMVPKIDTTITSIQWMFNERNPKGLYTTLNGLNTAIGHVNTILAGNEQNLELTIKNLQSISRNIERNNAAITSIINNANGITDSLNQADIKGMIENLNATVVALDSIVAGIKDGNGTIGKLVSNDDLYVKIDSTVGSLNNLLVDIKQRPYRYINVSVFGSKKREERIEKKYNESGK